MEQTKSSKAFFVASIISLAISGLGILSLIIGLVKKYFKRIWMPILSIVLGVIPFLGAVLLLLIISQW